MKSIFKIASLTYRTILFLIVPFEFIANFLVAAAGHNKSFNFTDYLVFVFVLTTAIVLTVYEIRTTKQKKRNTNLFVFTICLVLTTVFFQLYIQIDDIFICHCFEKNGMIANILMLSFLVVSVLVLVGLFITKGD